MTQLIRNYRTILTQGFVPIFVSDAFDAELLADAAVAGGAKAVEITCRRANAHEEIKRVKKAHPDLVIMAGSVVDDGPLLKHLQARQPKMPSIQQLIDAGADGIVSALPIREATIARVSKTHLIIPGVETATEAVRALEAGAQLAKLFTADLMGGSARVRRLTSAPTHALIPLFITGGITLARIPEYIEAGAAMLGSGWDVILADRYRELQAKPEPATIADAFKEFLDAFQKARNWPGQASISDAQFLAQRVYYHPF